MTRMLRLLATLAAVVLFSDLAFSEEPRTAASFAIAKNAQSVENGRLAAWPGYYYHGVYYGSYRWRYQPYYTFYASPWYDYGYHYAPYPYAWPAYGYGYGYPAYPYPYAPVHYGYSWPHYGAYGYTYYGPSLITY